MSSLNKDIKSKFNDLRTAIKEGRSRWIDSNGVNALVIVYPPEKEKEFLDRVYQDYGDQHIIDISELFTQLIDSYSLEVFRGALKDYKSTPETLFNNPKSEQQDLFKMIISEIEEAVNKDKIPILIRTGILHGTHIENTEILEADIINKSQKPLLVFYPAEVREDINEEERVYFLGVKKANDYRGQLI